MSTENFFYLNIVGQLEAASFPIGPDAGSIFCRYDIVVGADWEIVSGIKSGITQYASSSGSEFEEVIFNMPIECTFKSTNIYGWPQIVFSLYGSNIFGSEVGLGYARMHVPCNVHNSHLHQDKQIIKAPILTPKSSNVWASLVNWLTDRSPELKDSKVLSNGTKTKNLFTTSYGEIRASIQSISKGAEKLSLDI